MRPEARKNPATQPPFPRGVRVVVPASLSILRLVLTVCFVAAEPPARLPFVIAAGLSDWLDGLAARRLGTVTGWGAVLDALADKTFTIAVLVVLTLGGSVALWQVGLLLARDVVVVLGCGLVAMRGRRGGLAGLHVRWTGKAATLAIFAMLVVMVGWPEALWLGWVAFTLAAAASVAAAMDYAVRIARLLGATPEPEASGAREEAG
ncbi:MAG: CDP-alcohol phosphatidyltransferase family protein [Phycisphaerae bacterium]|nr:CDP-alcohol phosphatidyltransferase family protein [Phycisphaerae bacterium]MCZ2400602.1 CDP-alcohol phosphatidyltransferase family protein [Phycisphaerae bacterium]